MRSAAVVMGGAVVVAAAALLLGQASPQRSRSERWEVTAENVGSFYRDFDRLTAEPMEVSWRLSMACGHMYPNPEEQERERAGPHALAFVHLYSHGVDPTIFASPEREFPVGTIIVKEKLAGDLTPNGVGGMQKMEPGYDPEGGDWLYFYGSRARGFRSGQLETCRSCHARTKGTDFVYFVSTHDESPYEAR